MPTNKVIIDVKPNNYNVFDPKPRLSSSKVADTTTIYTETRTINKGQPVPWGLNWLMTYPIALTNFTATRI